MICITLFTTYVYAKKGCSGMPAGLNVNVPGNSPSTAADRPNDSSTKMQTIWFRLISYLRKKIHDSSHGNIQTAKTKNQPLIQLDSEAIFKSWMIENHEQKSRYSQYYSSYLTNCYKQTTSSRGPLFLERRVSRPQRLTLSRNYYTLISYLPRRGTQFSSLWSWLWR